MSDLQRTPLYDRHVALGAKMVPFAGFDMPVQYSGILDEHHAVRSAAGLFDVSHMGEVLVRGPHAFDFVQHLVSNNVAALTDGNAQYTVMCREDGGIVDDLLVYRRADQDYLLVINASNIEGDVAWMRANNPMGAEITDVSDRTGLLALQGPAAFDILAAASGFDASVLAFYTFAEPADGSFLGLSDVIISRTGYTGEPGGEIYTRAEDAAKVWDALLQHGNAFGLKPAGLGCRDTLRLESGYCLYGNDITSETNPLEAGLGWVTKLDASDFVGSQRLRAIKEAGPKRRLVGFVASERGIPRHGYAIQDGDGRVVGEVTSGTQSPILGKGIGLGYVANEAALTSPGAVLHIENRGRTFAVTVAKPPFHK
ncbi:MAG: glycine cleavage system aminomethyltransferase GcvT [Bacteroidetes bacterium]|nr:glycine cleavage system aminomethyltransferase GcvT [Bacteroidota bacterium]